MKLNKTLYFLMAVVLVLAFVVTGCAPTQTPETTEPATTEDVATEPAAMEESTVESIAVPENDTTITMWMLQEVDAYTQSIKDTIAAFEAENPTVTIELETTTADAWYSKVMTAMQSGNLPDIMYVDSINKVSVLYGKSVLESVDSVIDALGRDEFSTRVLDRYSKDGSVWSIPDVVLYEAIFYRTDLFEEYGISIPQTWDELYEAAKKLTIDENGDGTPDIYGMAIPLSKNMVADQTYGQYMYANGVHVFNPETGEYEFGSKKAEAIEALNAMVEMYQLASPPSSINWAWSDYRSAFVEGKTAMTPGWGAEIAMAKSENPDMLDNIGIFPFPAGPSSEQTPADTVGDAKSICLIKGTDADKTAASKAFLLYFMQPETQANRANTRPVFAIPSTSSAFNSAVYQSDPMVQMFSDETAMLFEKVIPYTYRTGGEGGLNPAGGSVEATMIFGNAIHNVLLEGWTVEQAIDWIDNQISKQLMF